MTEFWGHRGLKLGQITWRMEDHSLHEFLYSRDNDSIFCCTCDDWFRLPEIEEVLDL